MIVIERYRPVKQKGIFLLEDLEQKIECL